MGKLEFVKQDQLYDWCTNDAAGLYIRHTQKLAEPPEVFDCRVIGHSGIMRPPTMPVPTGDLVFWGAGLFGLPREKSETSAGWTGDCYRFGIYGYRPRFGRENVVILRTDGGGFYAYLDVSLTAAEMWRYLCDACSPEMLWNVCSCVLHTYDLAVDNGRKAIMQAFAEGRLHKKRGRNGSYVYLRPKIIDPAGNQPTHHSL